MSALLRVEGLTEQQVAFVRFTANGVPPPDAAIKAGYSDPSAHYRILQLPHVAAAIHAEIQRSLATEAAPAAFKVLRGIMLDATAPARVRADIGVKVMAMSGHVVPTTRDGAPQKQLNEMSAEELLAYIDRNQAELERLENELISRAKDVSAPVSAPTPGLIDLKPLNYLD